LTRLLSQRKAWKENVERFLLVAKAAQKET
jgi:hypothetical protein